MQSQFFQIFDNHIMYAWMLYLLLAAWRPTEPVSTQRVTTKSIFLAQLVIHVFAYQCCCFLYLSQEAV